ncbi:metal ABC transporter substrate-binding protein [Orrella marina]|uniref:Metal ABC transporter substrate-binding protein n=2 Tax=Orrella marina TaxID=2163011 RepID=A0A2R4XPU3_9BURK|nr:metal ABC transporter substrate-binding protein [Orrella marina]
MRSFAGTVAAGVLIRRVALATSVAFGTFLGVVPLGAHAADTRPDPLKVVASFSILADMVEQVGGSQVQVHSLVGRDADAHVFNPTPKDTRELAQADLVVINGLGFEGWLERLVKASGFKGPVVVASEGIEALDGEEDHDRDHHEHHGHHNDHDNRHLHDHGPIDPHAWQSLRNAKVYVANIRDALIEARPQAREELTARAASYIVEIEALDQQLTAALAVIPENKRKALISHDAFGYLAHDYGIEFLPVQGWSTGREASASDVASLIRQVRDGKVQAYFIENMSDARVLQRIADETGARSGGSLYSDALSAKGTEADTYLKMYQVNGRRLIEALQ